jgi:tol-pal system protein YbgF
MHPSRISLRVLGAAALVAAVSSSAFAQGGRQSLAERVERLEQQDQQGGQSGTDLVNQLTELRSEIQSLRGLVEQQTFKIDELEKRNRDHYVDLDARLTRMQGGAPAGAPMMDPEAVPPTAAAPAPDGTFTDVPPADPAPAAVMEPPVVQEPIDGGATTGQAIEPGIIQSTADPMTERAAYESAFDSLKEGRYAEAARRFQGFLEQYPSGEYSPNAQYWLGESYYVTQNYQIALEAFQRLLTNFPTSNKAPDALLKVGYCYYELRDWTKAESVLQQVVQQ